MTVPVLEVDNLSVSYTGDRDGAHCVVDGVSFSIQPGEVDLEANFVSQLLQAVEMRFVFLGSIGHCRNRSKERASAQAALARQVLDTRHLDSAFGNRRRVTIRS